MADKKKRLLAFNMRSRLNFSVEGLYGPKALLLESLPREKREKVLKERDNVDPSCDHHLYWSESPQNLLVIKKFRDEEVTLKFMELTAWLVKECGLSLTVEPTVLQERLITSTADYQEVRGQLSTWEEGKEDSRKQCLRYIDLIICVGGDGTLLYTSSMFQESIPPIMSFHMGSLGFLTPFRFENFRRDIQRVLKGDVSLTLRHRLKCCISSEEATTAPASRLSEDQCPLSPSDADDQNPLVFKMGTVRKFMPEEKLVTEMLVMNDLVIDRGPSPYITNLEIVCNGRIMTTVQGDGIIIASPTGSTAYSLAAGASMVHPSVPCLVVTPICPHSLSFRSIVVPAGVELTVRVATKSRNSAWVSFDGRNRREIKIGNSVSVTTSASPVPSINNTGHVTDWFDSLAECLQWNARKEQKELNNS